MTTEHLEYVARVLRDVEFRDWTFSVNCSLDRVYLYAAWCAPCNFKGGNDEAQMTRRWLIRPEASRSEIVQTAFACVLTAMEHEIREQFLYRDRAVFGPHHGVDELWEISGHMERVTHE